jgi:hypothetical protein
MPRRTPHNLWRNPNLSHWVAISRAYFHEQNQCERLIKRVECSLLMLEPTFFLKVDALLYLLENNSLLEWNEQFPVMRDELQQLIASTRKAKHEN